MTRNANVMLVMYDLPVKTALERKQNLRFHKKIIKRGYNIVQKSVYAKLIRNKELIKSELKELRDELPQSGEIKTLIINLADFREMNSLVGPEFDMRLFADEVLVV